PVRRPRGGTGRPRHERPPRLARRDGSGLGPGQDPETVAVTSPVRAPGITATSHLLPLHVLIVTRGDEAEGEGGRRDSTITAPSRSVLRTRTSASVSRSSTSGAGCPNVLLRPALTMAVHGQIGRASCRVRVEHWRS